MSATDPIYVEVLYVCTTPSGSDTTYTRRISLNQIGFGNPQSETATLGYLKKMHAGCEIQITRMKFG
jgi:hypothetical protein